MTKIPVIAVLDIGKTNKKLFLFNESYRVVHEKNARLPETADEDGDPCECIHSLRDFVQSSLEEALAMPGVDVRAVNVSAYGASLVYIDAEGKPLTPLYNYLKSYPEHLRERLYARYGGKAAFSRQTASPALDSLNSGLQLFRLQAGRPEVFAKVKHALHLPQYVSYLLSGDACADITSIGCHTAMWDFERNTYHGWVRNEGLEGVMAPLRDAGTVVNGQISGKEIPVGPGLHDSSAALIPYLLQFREPFALISTGTWCITLNPFNATALTAEELEQDCLCYLSFDGRPVKASRLFSGYVHEREVARIAEHFNRQPAHYQSVPFEAALMEKMRPAGDFAARDLTEFRSDAEAYHQLMHDLVSAQYRSTSLVLAGAPVGKIFVDGGFGKNDVFMQMLAIQFRGMEVYAAQVPQATALGAALALHSAWQQGPLPEQLIELAPYPDPCTEILG
ncbi:FGGY family carbohydrate kinase [Chitinophaga sp.]|uniref:FGGY-family carbohydrate kinase n=1 Tax=Chitinophaga sp. TaxID=1869181 RepID=UPI002629DE77|nr:FGGY family carbohydrate kinase [uncultured Chitinophaga sp.]